MSLESIQMLLIYIAAGTLPSGHQLAVYQPHPFVQSVVCEALIDIILPNEVTKLTRGVR